MKKELKKISDKELQELKNNVLAEISYRHLKKKNNNVKGRLYNIINKFSLKKLSEYTEDEFSHFLGVGKTTVKLAKSELAKEGLTFKQKR